MTTPHHDEDVVVLDRDAADDLAHLLERVEDWLRHADHDTYQDLAGFFNTAGNGRHAMGLHRQLRQVPQ